MERARVLLVDDTPQMIEYYKEILKGAAFEIVGAAPNALVALNMVRETAPGVVVLDIAMPRMTGIELAKRLRADGCAAALVFVSSDDALAPDAIAAGGSAFVSKNLADAYLLTAIREALAGRIFVCVWPPTEYHKTEE